MKNLLLISIILATFTSCTDLNNHTEKELETIIEQLEEQEKMKTTTANNNKQSVKAFFKALEDENIYTLVDLFDNEGKQVNPYHSNIFPKGANGKDEIRNYWVPVFPNFDGMRFEIEELYAMEDPNIVFTKYTGSITLKNNSGIYSNNYYSTFKFNNEGKIIEYVEIFNPITAAKGFGLIDKIK